MRVTGCEVFPVANPTPAIGGPVWLFLRLDTDAGVSGYGEAFTSALYSPPLTAARMLADFAADFAVGRDPGQIEGFAQSVYNSHFTHAGDLGKHALASAVEIALWDILGKSLGQPIHALLGGKLRQRVPMYSYISAPAGPPDTEPDPAPDFWADDDAIARRCAELKSIGFSGLKHDPFPILSGTARLAGQYVPLQPTEAQLSQAERVFAAIRAGVGPDFAIILGTHGQFTAAGAIRVAARLDKYAPLWMEEPVPPDQPHEMAKVRAATAIPLAAGERLAGLAGFADLIRRDAVAVVNPDVTQVGGLLTAKKIAALAEANGVQVAPHCFGGPLTAAAALQLALTLPNLLIMEGNGTYDGAYADLLTEPLAWRDGHLTPSDRPGLGHDLNEDWARAHRVTDQAFEYRGAASFGVPQVSAGSIR